MDQKGAPIPMDQIMKFASSESGKQLIKLLQQKNDPALQQAANNAAAGNWTDAKNQITDLLSDEKIRELLRQFGG